MPRTTYGTQPKKRVKRLLEALLCFADGEFGEDKFNIEYHWKEQDSANPKLTMKTTLVTLELLTLKDKDPGKLTKTQIREALNLLKDFVKILEDNRIHTKGVDEWHFSLKLWSRDREENLKQFDKVWESNRPKKSQQLEAHFTKDRSATVVPQTKLAIFQAPPLPAHFVERPEYSDDLKTRLLTEDNRTLVITAIYGLGSVGKSTLAAALAVDAEVQTRFCDGILWATLGQQPDVLSLLNGWVQALGDYSFKPTSVEATTNHLRTLLYDKAVLLVVDDAWNTQDAQAFNVGGVRCQVLVTTREGAIADALAASTYSLDIMKPSQAMALLTKKLRREITGAERHSAENLAKGVGYLPLALELAATEVASGTTWDELLADIRQEVAILRSFDRPEAQEITDEASLKRLSLTASLNLSVKRMPPEKQQHFAWLGVLPEDVNINKMMAATLWAMDERDAAKILQYLRNKALLLTGVPLADGTPSYRLHDLFHDLACNLLTAAPQPRRIGDLPGLGLNLTDAHAALLEKYRQKTQNNLWHTLPNDGYIHQRLVWHFEKAGQIEAIHKLLQEESLQGGNGWYEVREKLGQTAGYLADISKAWELAETSWAEATLPKVVGLQCRYALITASLNSLAANLSEDLLIVLVKNKVWIPEQGLAYADLIPNPQKKVIVLIKIVNYLPISLKAQAWQQAFTAVKTINDEKDRIDILTVLVDKLSPELMSQALEIARSISDEQYRTKALSVLVDKLSPELMSQALEIARSISDEQYRTKALSVLIDKLSPELMSQALEIARSISDEQYRTKALSVLVDKLSPELMSQALEIARSISDEQYRTKALSVLVDKLSPELMSQALEIARSISDEQYRTKALSALVDKLPEALIPQALMTARSIINKEYRVSALSTLADRLPDALQQALAMAYSISDEEYRINTLSALADKLPEVLPEVLAAVRSIQSEQYRASALSALVEKLPREVLPEALAAVRSIQSEQYRASALSALVEKLPPELLPDALTAAKTIQSGWFLAPVLNTLADKLPEALPEMLATAARSIVDESFRASTLSDLANKLPEALIPEALAAARSIKDESSRVAALNALVSKLPEILIPKALMTARSIIKEEYRASALSALANKLPEALIPEALAAVRSIADESSRASALSALANKLPEALIPEALVAARSIKDESSRVSALNALVGKLPEILIPEVLMTARSIVNEEYRASALSALANKLPETLMPEALAAVRSIADESSRVSALNALVGKLPEILIPEALITARSIVNEEYRASALRALANKLPKALMPEALAAVRSITDESSLVPALSALTDKQPMALSEVLAAARSIADESSRASVLKALADKLPEALMPEALAAARSIRDESSRASVLKALADKLPEALMPEALATARSIKDESSRASALKALADKLPEALMPEALAAARSIKDESSYASALKALAYPLSKMSTTQLFPLWQQTLHELSLRTRQELLQGIEKLVPIIFALGGRTTVAEVVCSINAIARWWH